MDDERDGRDRKLERSGAAWTRRLPTSPTSIRALTGPWGHPTCPHSRPTRPVQAPLHLRLGRPAARRLHDQARHRPRGLRRGLLRHLRLRQGSRAQADPAQPRRRAPRGRAVHEPEVPEPADDLRPEDQRRRRHVRRHGVRRRPQPGQRPEAVSRRAAAGRGPPLAQGAGRGRRLPARPRDRPPRPEAGQPVHGGGDRQDRRLRPGQADHAQPGDRALREHRHLPLHGPRDRLGQVPQADRRLRDRRDPLRDAHRPGAVRGRDGQRGADEAPDGAARRVDAARAVPDDRGQGPGQGPEPSAEPGLRPAAARGRAAARRRPDHRRRQGGRRPRADGRRPAAAGGGRAADRGRGAGLLHRPRDAAARAAARDRRSGSGGGRPRSCDRGASGQGRGEPIRQVSPVGSPPRAAGRRRPSRRRCPAAGFGSPSWPPRCSGPPR